MKPYANCHRNWVLITAAIQPQGGLGESPDGLGAGEARRCRHGSPPRNSSRANSMAIGLGYLGVKVIARKALGFALYLYLFDHFRVFTLDIRNPLHWIGAWMVGDFIYYWIHRAEHRVRVVWCTHLVHHSSQEFSFTTAVRMPWTEVL